MKHKKLRGVVAMLLTLVMMVGMLPTSVYAADADGGGNSVVIESVSDPVEVSSESRATCRRSRWLFCCAKRDVDFTSGTRSTSPARR